MASVWSPCGSALNSRSGSDSKPTTGLTKKTVDLRPWTGHLPAGSSLDASDLTVRTSLPAAWASMWGSAPGAPLLLDGRGDGSSRWTTAGQFDETTRAVAGALARLGLRGGDRMVWSMSSSLASAAIVVGALRAGVVVVPANPSYTIPELGHIVDDAMPVAAVVDDPALATTLAEAHNGLIVVGPELVRAGSGRVGTHEDGARGMEAAIDRCRPDAPALIAYTSGTTGSPKGAVLSHANLLASSESVAATWRWSAEDRLVHGLPIFHVHGLCVALFGTLLAGASAILLPRFDSDAVLDAAAAQRATLFFGVPTMYHRLVSSGRGDELGRLRLCVSGSAPLPAELHREIGTVAGTSVLERYGMTETLMAVSNPYQGERRAGTVGFPFPGVEVKLVDEQIWVRGPAVFSGYHDRPHSTAEAFSEGWFRTGDLGAVDDGYLRILGRSVELIISGGFNVYPAEVEDVLHGCPEVAEVAVTGTPSDEWGEIVTAWVVPASGGGPEVERALLAYAAQRLAPYKRPRLVRFVDVLPRNAMGKVTRSELR
jgi:malonyl-CoA/methylmalonyl-CoA synthetase